jgi:hypothetical protein
VKTIDFLPDIYRQRAALRRARLWWFAVFLLLGTAIGASATAQAWLRRSLDQELIALAPQFDATQEQVRTLTQLNAQITRANQEANLYTYLDHPWPRTQLLAEIVRPLPAGIRLSQLHIREEEQARTVAEAGPRSLKADEPAAPVSPPEFDLTRLQEQLDRKLATMEIDGHTADVARLHAYVESVNRSPLVATAHIKSLEAAAAGQPGRTRFTLRVVVKPGLCQAGEGPPPAASTAAPRSGANVIGGGG